MTQESTRFIWPGRSACDGAPPTGLVVPARASSRTRILGRVCAAPVDWTANGWGIRVSSAHELFRLISHIALLEQSRIYAWRGQRDASWQFDSSLYRMLEERDGTVTEEAMRAAEQEIESPRV